MLAGRVVLGGLVVGVGAGMVSHAVYACGDCAGVGAEGGTAFDSVG